MDAGFDRRRYRTLPTTVLMDRHEPQPRDGAARLPPRLAELPPACYLLYGMCSLYCLPHQADIPKQLLTTL